MRIKTRTNEARMTLQEVGGPPPLNRPLESNLERLPGTGINY